jgi:hypothetical protein
MGGRRSTWRLRSYVTFEDGRSADDRNTVWASMKVLRTCTIVY